MCHWILPPRKENAPFNIVLKLVEDLQKLKTVFVNTVRQWVIYFIRSDKDFNNKPCLNATTKWRALWSPHLSVGGGDFSWCCGERAGLQHHRKRVRTPVRLLHSLSDHYHREKYDIPCLVAGISTFVYYLMSKPSLLENSCDSMLSIVVEGDKFFFLKLEEESALQNSRITRVEFKTEIELKNGK